MTRTTLGPVTHPVFLRPNFSAHDFLQILPLILLRFPTHILSLPHKTHTPTLCISHTSFYPTQCLGQSPPLSTHSLHTLSLTVQVLHRKHHNRTPTQGLSLLLSHNNNSTRHNSLRLCLLSRHQCHSMHHSQCVHSRSRQQHITSSRLSSSIVHHQTCRISSRRRACS